eukprot:gene10432-6101_t
MSEQHRKDAIDCDKCEMDIDVSELGSPVPINCDSDGSEVQECDGPRTEPAHLGTGLYLTDLDSTQADATDYH